VLHFRNECAAVGELRAGLNVVIKHSQFIEFNEYFCVRMGDNMAEITDEQDKTNIQYHFQFNGWLLGYGVYDGMHRRSRDEARA